MEWVAGMEWNPWPGSSGILTIPKELWKLRNETLNLMLLKAKTNSKLPEIVKGEEKKLSELESKLRKDITKTEAAKILILGDHIEKSIMRILNILDSERQYTFQSVEENDKKIERQTKFKDTTDLLLATRYGDSVKNKSELLKYVKDDFTAARLLLHDPLTRKRFHVKKGDVLDNLASATVQMHVLGEGGREDYNNKLKAIDAFDEYGKKFTSVLDRIDKVTAPIKANIVEV